MWLICKIMVNVMSLIQTAVIIGENPCYEMIILASNINMAMNKAGSLFCRNLYAKQTRDKSAAFVSVKINSFWLCLVHEIIKGYQVYILRRRYEQRFFYKEPSSRLSS